MTRITHNPPLLFIFVEKFRKRYGILLFRFDSAVIVEVENGDFEESLPPG